MSDAALLLFASQGYDATTTRQIAEAANVTERNFFKHFPVKADAILDLPVEDLDLLCDLIVAQPPELSEVEALQSALTEWFLRFDDMEERHRWTRLLLQASTTSVVIRGRLNDYAESFVRTAAVGLARRLQEARPTPRTRMIAAVVVRAHSFITVRWARQDGGDFATIAADHYRTLNAAFAPLDP